MIKWLTFLKTKMMAHLKTTAGTKMKKSEIKIRKVSMSTMMKRRTMVFRMLWINTLISKLKTKYKTGKAI